MIAVLFGTYYLINTLTTPALEPITVFTADAAPQHITLQKDNGEKIVLDEPQSNNQTLPQKMISKSEKKELDYRQVISTTTQTHVLLSLIHIYKPRHGKSGRRSGSSG